MKKTLVTVTSVLMLTFTFTSTGVPAFHLNGAHAATTTATTAVASSTVAPVNPYNNQAAVDAKADQLISFAESLIGKATYSHNISKTPPYRFACASFINFVFQQNGVDLATSNQNYMINQGYAVPRDQLQKGDLIFFNSTPGSSYPADHVAMYIGNNKIIHMANAQLNVVISDLNSTDYYRNDYVTARRVLPSLLAANPATLGDKIVASSFSLVGKATIGSVNNPAALSFTKGGLTNYIYQQNGVNLGTTALKDQMTMGQPVARTNLKKGDLVFFNSVVGSNQPFMAGIYAGDNRVIVSMPSSGVFTRVLDDPWYNEHYLTARRFVPTTTSQPQTLSKADQVIQTAQSLVGKASYGFKYDTQNDIFTGGGFTYYVFKQNGVNLHYTLISRQELQGSAVSKSQLQKGDILYFSTDGKQAKATQAGIYLGNNQFIYLSRTKGIVTESLDSTWALNNYMTARRVLN